MISRRSRDTNLSAKGPLAIAWERIGSVHVTHDPITSAASCKYVSTWYREIDMISPGQYQGELRDGRRNASRGTEPHYGHDWKEADEHLLPPRQLVFGWQLVSCNNELDADDDTAEALEPVSELHV